VPGEMTLELRAALNHVYPTRLVGLNCTFRYYNVCSAPYTPAQTSCCCSSHANARIS